MELAQNELSTPKALRVWFMIHFWADILFAIPLMVSPETCLEFFGWQKVDPFTTRLVAAALFGIGIESLVARHARLAAFREMLNLKIIWSGAAIIGIGLSIWQGAQGRPFFAWVILSVFIGFNILWVFWRIKIKRLLDKSTV
jgi:hypothetical protein